MSILFLFSLFLLLLPLHFSSIFLLSSAYTLPDKYFINCGSESNSSFGLNRVFVGDVNPDTLLMINPGKSEAIRDETISKSIPEIYHTVRVYDRPTWYVFDNINENGTYLVRLHFFPLSSKTYPNISKARFDIWVSSMYPLLSNFSLESNLEKAPVVKEFAFGLPKGPFGIRFSPSIESPVAFVNAIEVYLAPTRFKPDSAYPVSPEVRTNDKDYEYELGFDAFQAIYRINMGGSLVTPDKDTLWRTWLPDDGFLVIPATAKNISFLGKGEINYGTVIDKYTAPSFVFNSAKELNMDRDQAGHLKFSNITWVFKVRKKAKYFIRLMWCDFQLRWDNSGLLNIGIARNDNKSKTSRVFLNGLEIMELIEKEDSGPLLKMPKGTKQHLIYILIVALLGGLVLLALVIGLLWFYLRVRKSKKSRRSYQEFICHDKPHEKICISDLAPNLNLELKISLSEIKIATCNFDEKKVIGVGGFGKVYHGTLGEKQVAVKRSRPGFDQGLHEFQTEIIVLSQIRHRHLVSLYGYCDENAEMILVYEFMEKGTLRQYLYNSSNDHSQSQYSSLSWKQRLEICIDAAKGIDYLHTGSAGGVIIHRDVKTTNILLDKDYKAKVADFGTSKSGVPDPDQLETTIRGTYGYLDPEYFNTGRLTEKSDVYSFGVVLFEVLSARSPIVGSLPEEEVSLVEWAVVCKKRGEIEKLIDPFLVETIQLKSLHKFVVIAEKCLNEHGAERPSMHDVVHDLELALQLQYTDTEREKAFACSTIVETEAERKLSSQSVEEIIPCSGHVDDDSTIIDNDSATINAREMVEQFKIDCAR